MKKELLVYSLPICARLGVLASKIGSVVRSIDTQNYLLNHAEDCICNYFKSEVKLLKQFPDIYNSATAKSANASIIRDCLNFAVGYADDKKFCQSILAELVNEFCGLSVALRLMNDDYFGGVNNED